MTPELDRLVDALSQRYFGKYRGEVVATDDPSKRGRVQVLCPAVMGDKPMWATPCVPYAGDQLGLFALPKAGTSVWVEFEAGEISQPIWAGCFWKDGEIPAGDEQEPIAFLRTPGGSIRIDSDSGTIEIEAAGGAKITMTSDGITIEAPQVAIEANGGSLKVSASGVDAMNGAFTVV